MHFNRHYNVEGKHAFLGASKYHWVNYDIDKMRSIFKNQFASQHGSRLHAWAAETILLGRRQPRNKETLNSYINDAIGFRMEPEVVLYVNDEAFGTADAIAFDKNILRVHDLKTGVHPGSPHQIEVYFAFFCLEYKHNPYDIEMVGRIYQNDEILEFHGDPKRIREIMEITKLYSREAVEMREVML